MESILERRDFEVRLSVPVSVGKVPADLGSSVLLGLSERTLQSEDECKM